MWSLSDEALLAGLASRDVEVSAAFIRRFQSRVFGLAVTVLEDREDAMEAAQETFLRAYKHADAYDARRGAVATWLLTITRNVSIDMLRTRRTEPRDPAAFAALFDQEVEDGPPDFEDIDRVRTALQLLPPEQRRALILATFYGRTAREISELDGLPLGTVKTRVRAGLA
ncbi:MAG: RNA polymerase sigma factor, partial [Actinomycetota bacterium]